MLSSNRSKLEIVGQFQGEPIYAIDEPVNGSAPTMSGPIGLVDVLNDIVDVIEDLDAVHSNIIEQIKENSAVQETTPEIALNKAGIIAGLNRRAAVAGLALLHLKAIIGTANQVLG